MAVANSTDFPATVDEPDAVDAEAARMADLQMRVERLQMFSHILTKRRTEAVTARAASGTERRWLDDLDSYQGRDAATRRVDLMDSVRGEQQAMRRTAKDTTQAKRSTVFVQLTRQKTNACAARASDMLFPTDDKNWGIKPTPVPELMEALKTGADKPYIDPQTGGPLLHPNPGPTAQPAPQQPAAAAQTAAPVAGAAPADPNAAPGAAPAAGGAPAPAQPAAPAPPPNPFAAEAARLVTYADLAAEQMQIAQAKATAMEKEIDDQLTECSYNGEGRKIIQDAAKLGTGILKGPAVTNRIKKKWTKKRDPATGKSVQMLEVMEVIRPQSYRVDPWNFYPDPSCGEDHQNGAYVFEREYMPGRVLSKMAKIPGYNWQSIAACLAEGPQHVQGEGSYTDNVRAGDLAYNQGNYDDKRFELWTYTGDVDRDDLSTIGIMVPEDAQSFLTTFSCVIVMCNNRIIKAMLSPLDMGDFPYDLFHWERVDLSPFGVGVPYLMRYAQRTLNAAWRAMLDNMALSSGPQIVMNKKAVVPADGNWELTARKLWWMAGDADDVEKAFEVYEVASHQQDIAAIIDLAQKFADEETSLPQIAQGEQGSAPDTVGGMSILMNSANTVLRRIVKQYDDEVTRPHLRRYYDWNMQYNENEEIKGDFEVDARGSSVLIVRDQMQQGIMNTMQMAKDPEYAIYVNKEKLFKKSLEMQHVTPDDVMNTPEQITAALEAQKNAPPPTDPRIEAAQIKAKSDEAIAASKAESEKEYAKTQAQIARDDHAATMAKLELQRDLALLQYATQQKMQLTDVRKELALAAMQQNHTAGLKQAENMTRAAQQSGPADSATPISEPDKVYA